MVPAMSIRPTCSGTVIDAWHSSHVSTAIKNVVTVSWRPRRAQEHAQRALVTTKATREPRLKYQRDIQTKLRPGDFADREDNKSNHLAAAEDWQTVVKLFYELGNNIDRNVSLVGDMLVTLQRLAPPAGSSSSSSGGSSSARLSAKEASVLAAGIMSICSVLVDNIQKVNNKLLINIIWALALLPDPTKTITTPATAAARARCVGVFGAAVLNRMSRYTAEEVLHVCAGLAMVGFKPPRTLQSDRAVTTFAGLIEKRTIKVMHYISPKAIADAGYVAARLVAPGDMSAEWLKLFAYVSRQQMGTMQPEALIYAGYALARHGFKPSNTWRKRYMDGVFEVSKTLEGEEFPMVLFTLAKWQQQQQQQQDIDGDEDDELDFQQQQQQQMPGSSAFTSSSSGPCPSQTLINNLLLASHTNRALKQLPLGQLVVMLKSLTELDCYISPQWLQRLWPVINAQIDAAAEEDAAAAAASSSALCSNLAALLAVLPKLNPKPDLPADFLDIAVGNLGVGLDELIQQNPRDLAAAWAALQQLHYTPDQIFMRQLQQAVMQGLPAVACKDMDALLLLGIAAAGSSDAAAAELYHQQLLEGFCDEVSNRVGLVSGQLLIPAAAAVAAAGGVGRVALQWQQQQQRRQQLLDNAAAEGLWRLPQTIFASIDQLNAAIAAAASSSSSALSTFLPQLQQIWRQAAVGLASVMPTEPLLVLLNFLLDLENNKQQQQQLGLTNQADRQSVTLDVLKAGVYSHTAAGSSSNSSSKGRKSAAAAAAAGSSNAIAHKDLLVAFSVADWQELLVIIADAGLQDSVPNELLTLASEGLHKALSDLPKAKIPSEDMTEDEYLTNESALAAINSFLAEQLVDDFVIILKQDYGFSMPAKVKSRYKAVKQLSGQDLPLELTQRSSKKKTAASSKQVGSSSSSNSKLEDTVTAPIAILSAAAALQSPTAAAAAAAAATSSISHNDGSLPSLSDGSTQVVRSSRSTRGPGTTA